MLAIPPGFASAVWPASGVALTAVLLLNRTAAALGIGFGSFLLNLGVASGGYESISWSATISAASIATGTVLQALITAVLFLQLLGKEFKLETPVDIMRFLLVVCPLGCLIASTIGVTSLYLNGIIPPQNYAFSWVTWWVGDTIGVMLFTPMLLVLFSAGSSLKLTRKLQIILPTSLIFFAVLQIFFTSTKAHNLKLKFSIEENAQQFFHAIEERFNFTLNTLNAFEAFFQSSENVTRNEFDLFTSIILKNDSVFQGIGWTPIVEHDEREIYQAQVQQEGFPEFTFTEFDEKNQLIEAPERDEYYPVLYIFPLESNRKALGLNLSANQVRYQAILKASLSTKPTATEPVRLAQEAANEKAIIIYYPLFLSKKVTSPYSDSTDKNTRSFISGVIRMSGIAGDLINESKQLNYTFSLKDITDEGAPKPLYISSDKILIPFSPVIEELNFAGRKIEFTFYPTGRFQSLVKDWNSWTILTTGFTFAALLQALILMITGTTENIRQEVNRKTRALQEATKIAEQASKAKSDFTANISHEIRTPLNAIVGLINMTLKSGLSDLQRDYLEKAKLASGTLTSLINSTLDFSKIEAGKLEVERVVFDISELLKKIRAIFSTQAMEKDISFEMEYPVKCPKFLVGDPLRIEQVLLNLCSNAFKFTQQGSVRFIIKLTSQSKNAVEIEFRIIDSGIGIPQAHQKLLFESFQQADSSTSRKFGGTGLGLAISKSLVEIMGGRISFKSQPEVGSEFIVTLQFEIAPNSQWLNSEDFEAPGTSQQLNEFELRNDAINAHSEQNARSLLETPDFVASQNQLAYISILLVEDVELNQLIAQAMLEEFGASVTIAENGVEALKILSSGKSFDLILMDIQMPEMDGYEATRQIRSQLKYRHIPIVAMTANVMKEDVEKCLAVGMNGHIGKPLEDKELLKTILDNLPLGKN